MRWQKLGLGAVPFVVAGGCATITPPARPADPVTVYLVDYGRHASLVLRDEPAGWVEFAYGEWGWFAKGNNGLIRAPLILLLPARGTLGRAALGDLGPDPGAALDGVGEQVFAIDVERDAATALRGRLHAAFDEGRDRLHRNASFGMDFVPVPEPYCLLHNCNGRAAAWLRELGCRVRGVALFANFRLARPAG